MKKLALLLLAVGLFGSNGAEALAQVGLVTYYRPVPVTVFRPAPVVYTTSFAPAPVVSTPVVSAPIVTTVSRPVVATAPVVAPAPVVVQPVTRVRTRFRPILGGTVTRVAPVYRTFYAPPVVYGF